MWNVITFLIVVGILLLVIETIMPGGIIGTIGLILAVSGIVMTYREYGMTTGHIVLSATTLGSLLFIYLGLKIFPKTKLGKLVILDNSVSKARGFDSSIENLKGLAGKNGIAVSNLRPVGIALIDGKRVDVISDGGYIEKDTPILVLRVDGSKVLVVAENNNIA